MVEGATAAKRLILPWRFTSFLLTRVQPWSTLEHKLCPLRSKWKEPSYNHEAQADDVTRFISTQPIIWEEICCVAYVSCT